MCPLRCRQRSEVWEDNCRKYRWLKFGISVKSTGTVAAVCRKKKLAMPHKKTENPDN